jgi:hypothetical protein
VRSVRFLAVLVAIAAVAAAAIFANLALLDYASAGDDPVGKLTPRGSLPAAPPGVVRPHDGPSEDDQDDD